jgi:hypothetical protein
MFSTSLVLAAFSGLEASGSVAGLPAWQTDYRTALQQAAEQQKPVAVFIARGGDGYATLVTDGGIGGNAAKQLRSSYVCLYVDTATDAGKALAGSFRMTAGVVISDKAGTHQAARVEGPVSQGELARQLERFSDVPVAQTTEQVSAAAVAAPVAYPQGYAPAYQGFGSGCASGNCGRGMSFPMFGGGGCASGNCGRR